MSCLVCWLLQTLFVFKTNHKALKKDATALHKSIAALENKVTKWKDVPSAVIDDIKSWRGKATRKLMLDRPMVSMCVGPRAQGSGGFDPPASGVRLPVSP